jgi:CBS domain-containing protein
MAARVAVSGYMATDLISLTPDTGIIQAMTTLLDNRISGAPVLDKNGRLVGVLSQKDCLRAALNASYHQELGGIVGDYMSTEVETIEADLDIVQAAERFISSPYRRFPVTRHGRLVGQISRADLLRALVEQWGTQRS